ncbi:unnamed protein product [Brachionus calyciflorus]|uniref:Uncharacterized protein n=1 Tax=Brachionus calyciflorus TaxID=104777 RepID=A0A814LWT7_9BILA|nr:unnamed protein product [Brachionus calyciflorus]
MSKRYLNDKFCAVCKTRFYSTNKRTINEISNSDLILKLNNLVNDNQTIKVVDLVCSKCKKIDHVMSVESESTTNDNKIEININEKLIPTYIQSNDYKKTNEWLKHNSYISSEIFCENTNNPELILVCDGTYCYCEQSSNNTFQRSTYSVQKKRHLVKPFVICTTYGFIVDIYGLYEATKNDSSILLDSLFYQLVTFT